MKAFWNKVEKRGDTECWPWIGQIDRQGYGRFRWTWRGMEFQMQASRFALSLTTTPAFNWLLACHTCDNPRCCNPKHLYWGDLLSNTADRVNRNRSNRKAQPGVAHIARQMAAQGHSITAIAKTLKVTRHAVKCATKTSKPRMWNRKSPSFPPTPPLAPP